MSNLAIDSQNKSSIVKALLSKPELKKDSIKNFLPKLEGTYPAWSKRVDRVSPNTAPSGSIWGASNIQFRLHDRRHIKSVDLKGVYSVTTNNDQSATSATYFGTDIVNVADLRQSGRHVASSGRRHNLSMIENAETDQRSGLLNTTAISAFPNNTTAAYTVYTPLHFWYDQEDEDRPDKLALDTRRSDDLTLNIEYSLKADVLVNANITAVNFTSVELIVTYFELDPMTYNDLSDTIYKDKDAQVVYAYDTVVEPVSTLTYASGATLDFTVNSDYTQLMTKASVQCFNETQGSYVDTSRVQFRSSGQVIVDNYKKESILTKSSKKLAGITSSRNFTHFFSSKKDDMEFSGGLSFRHLPSRTWTVTVDTSAGVSGSDVLSLYIVYTYVRFLSIGKSGLITEESQD